MWGNSGIDQIELRPRESVTALGRSHERVSQIGAQAGWKDHKSQCCASLRAKLPFRRYTVGHACKLYLCGKITPVKRTDRRLSHA